MVKKTWKVVIPRKVRSDLKEVYEYLLEESQSPELANRIRGEIVDRIRDLEINPHVYEPDRFRLKNDGTYRAFEKHTYRVSYRIIGHTIRIVRVRYARKKPLDY